MVVDGGREQPKAVVFFTTVPFLAGVVLSMNLQNGKIVEILFFLRFWIFEGKLVFIFSIYLRNPFIFWKFLNFWRKFYLYFLNLFKKSFYFLTFLNFWRKTSIYFLSLFKNSFYFLKVFEFLKENYYLFSQFI